MKTPRGTPVRTLPPKRSGRLPWVVEAEGEEKYCRKTPMMVNTDTS